MEKTASIAAYYSKARHSALVPVIYTQRKYVRKPRGARPGQVLCAREKMIMVEPLLPDNKE
jgi:predicted ribosome quality control (RQC) complex YloA/Tae2 family protein